MTKIKFWLSALSIVSLLAGCITEPMVLNQSIENLAQNKAKEDLQKFSDSKTSSVTSPIMVAVGEIRDKTGSIDAPVGSKSVTQGATEIAKMLLQTEPYKYLFVQQDGQNLDLLLRERQLAQRYNAEIAPVTASERLNELISPALKEEFLVPELAPVSYLITGAVVGFDKNIDQEVDGLSVNIIRATEEYSIDQVTVSMFATSVETGEIVSAKMNSQLVSSFKGGWGFYGFPLRDVLLELENGSSQNSATTRAVTVAIDYCLSAIAKDMLITGVAQ